MANNEGDKAGIQFISLGKLGIVLLVVSVIVVAVVAYVFPSFENIFNATILRDDNTSINFLIRLYAGFLASSAVLYLAQFVLWLLMKGSLGLWDYTTNLVQVKAIRTISVVAVGLLFAALFLFAGMTVVRL